MKNIFRSDNFLKIKFKNKSLIIAALTHKSANQKKNNEKLEFLGDRVIGLVLSQKLFDLYPNESEGVLDKRFASLVKRKTCCDIAWSLGLQNHIITGNVKKIVSIKNKNTNQKLIIDATSLDIADNSAIPTEFKLHENYPNPFNPSTNIKFDIPENGLVSLIVYDLMGHKVTELVNTNMNSGFHNVSWNGTDNFGNTVSTGVYIYQLKTGNYSNTQKMLFIK